MAQTVRNVVKVIERLAPRQEAQSWDQVGLQLGSLEDPVQRVLVALEVTEKVLEEAAEKDVQLIVAHHPFLFKKINRIIKEEARGRMIYQAIQKGISIYAAHTNIDSVPGGLNEEFAARLGLLDAALLDITGYQEYEKLVVFVPESHVSVVSEALWQAGAGHIGNYSHCSFQSRGTGTFKPLEGTQPFTGTQGQLEAVQEIRLETILPKERTGQAVEAMLKAHPYEEVAYDLYPLAQKTPQSGIGRVGTLAEPIPQQVYIETIKQALKIPRVRLIGDPNRLIERVCLVNGSGAEYISAAAAAGCQLLVTGDVKYHDAQTALELGLNVVDAGHYETEAYFVEWLAAYLNKAINAEKPQVEIFPAETYLNPFQIL